MTKESGSTSSAAPVSGAGGRPLRRDAERNRRLILDAARRLVADLGLDVSHDVIAQAAGVGVGTVYRRFPDKQDLLDELFDERVDDVVAVAEAALTLEDPWDGLCAFIAGNLELQAGDQGLKEIMLGSARDGELARRGQQRIGTAVGQLVRRAHASGQLRPDVGVEDFPLIPIMVGAVMEDARTVDPQLWRRALALVLDGYRQGPRTQPLPGDTPSTEEIEGILSRWRPPRRPNRPRSTKPSPGADQGAR